LRHGFALLRAADITTARIRAYVTGRQQEGAANATITANWRWFYISVRLHHT
jgi:hypothetical protein